MDKDMTLHHRLIAEFDEFYKVLTGLPYKYEKQDFPAIGYIRKYLLEISKGDEEKALNGFKYILTNWKHLSTFHQSQVKISQINSNLPNIILFIKNARTSKYQHLIDP